MKKILGLSIAALLIIAIVGVGTWAYFSDTEASTGNSLIAGTLDLGLSNTDNMSNAGITSTWSSTDWAPGSSSNGTLYISNDGTIDVTSLTVSFDYTAVDTSARPATISGSPWTTVPTDYFDQMVTATTATLNGTPVAAIEGLTLAELKAAGAITLPGGLTHGTTVPLFLEFTFGSSATNGCQGNSVDVTVSVTGTQN
jgi:spore coat-associated protein N